MRRLLAFLPLLLALIGCQATPAATSTQVPPTTTGEALQVAATEVAPPASAGPTGLPGKALATFTTAHYSGSGVCSACHTGLVDESGADVSNIDHWRSTMMANASKDPVWLAKVSSEVKRTPGLQAIIEDKCVVCHMPMAEEQLKSEGGQPALFGDGFIAGDNPLHEAAMDGVSCTLCHQIGPQNLGTQESFSGGYLVDGETQRPERLIYGPYENPIAELMQTVSGFRPQHSAHLASSEQCATCHELFTPYVDDEGNILGEFPEQTPYGEWEASSYGASGVGCQTCHMPAAKGGVVVSTMPAGLSPRQPFYQHHFAGGNAQILRVLRDNPDALGTTASAGQFDATIERVRGQLGQAAQVTISDLSTEGTTLTAGIKVSATTGHKFPTSFPSRRAWLHVTVNDAAGRPVF